MKIWHSFAPSFLPSSITPTFYCILFYRNPFIKCAFLVQTSVSGINGILLVHNFISHSCFILINRCGCNDRSNQDLKTTHLLPKVVLGRGCLGDVFGDPVVQSLGLLHFEPQQLLFRHLVLVCLDIRHCQVEPL